MVQWDKVLQVQVLVKQKVVLFLQAVLSSAYFNKKKLFQKQCCGSERLFYGFGSRNFFARFRFGFGF
jgi:hypothetical protein